MCLHMQNMQYNILRHIQYIVFKQHVYCKMLHLNLALQQLSTKKGKGEKVDENKQKSAET